MKPVTAQFSLGALHRLVLLAPLALTACAGDTNPVRDVLVSVGAGAQPTAAPEFVQQSRPATLDYMPVGTRAPDRDTAARSAAEVKATEAELDAIRTRNEAAARAAEAAGATPPPEPATVRRPAARSRQP
ncbi:MAG TPA: hypothetical protein VIL09_10385 [Microvirga sp.]|jgi:pyruvate/2-oxoglutarate dehydrogenase complex dihydrolipoamide acyltransferase (E2) component